jgi:hypothetical protein
MSEYTVVNGELKHYGIIGMKWGVRRARRKEAKQAYKKATDKAFSEYERSIKKIEQPYKRGQNPSAKDQARELAAEKRYADAAAKAKAQYKRAKTDKSNDAAILKNKYGSTTKSAAKRMTQMSTGKALGQAMLMGSYGAMRYNELRAGGQSRGKAAAQAIMDNAINQYTYGALGRSRAIEDRAKRK